MTRLSLALAAVVATLLATSAANSAAHAADEPSLEKHTYPATETLRPRDYYVAAPAGAPRGLILFLHGCNQTAPDAAVGTQIHTKGVGRGYVVVLPEQAPYNETFTDGNNSACWNWFLPDHQSRTRGEPATLAAIARSVAVEYGVAPTRIFVTGISAGADMTTILGATHPDLFAAIAPYSGCAYLTCADTTGEAAYAAMGDHRRLVPALIAQGSADVVNNAVMGETALRQWLGTNDRADDGEANASVGPQPSSQETFGADGNALAPGTGDPCVGESRLPCAGVATGSPAYPYTVSRYTTASGATAVEYWLIHGLNHAYPGGDPRGSFVDPAGPDLTTATIDFFDRHPMVPVSTATAGASAGHTVPGGHAASGGPSAAAGAALPATGATGGRGLRSLALAALAAALFLRRRP